jgi:hypothetical protein
MPICATITANIVAACGTAKSIAGVDGTLVALFNYEDWQKLTLTKKSGSQIFIEAITAPTGVVGFKVEGVSPNTMKPKYSKVTDNGLVRFTHAAQVLVETITETAREQVSKMLQGRVVLIFFSNSKEIIIAGAGTGLMVADGDIRDWYANSGAHLLNFATVEGVTEPTETLYYVGSGVYDFATAKADIVALLTP